MNANSKVISVESEREVSECYLTTAEAAEFLRVSEAHLRNLTSARKVRYFKLGRSNRYKQSDLLKLIKPAAGGF
jgi:excisionase family DNA binding protein